MKKEQTIFRNNKVRVIQTENGLVWYDLEDKYNDFTGYTQNVRGLKKATAFIIQLSKDERLKHDLKMGDVTKIMEKFKLKPHIYCGMD